MNGHAPVLYLALHEARETVRLLEVALGIEPKPHRGHNRLAITISVPNLIVKGTHMSATITTAQKVSLTAGYVDPANPPAGDAFSWSIDASGAATLDATSGETVNLVAEAEGSGVVTLNDSAGLPAATLDYTVTASVTQGLTITVGPVSPK